MTSKPDGILTIPRVFAILLWVALFPAQYEAFPCGDSK
jgi:hypothetical protein